MALLIELPPPLDEELAIEAEREGVSVSDQAALLLHIITALTRDGRKTPFRSVIRSFLKQNEIDADRMAEVCAGLMVLCGVASRLDKQSLDFDELLKDSGHQVDMKDAWSLLRGWRSPDVHRPVSEDLELSVSGLPPLGELIQKSGRIRRDSVMGKYAWIGGSSREYAIEKQQEIDREDRRR